MNYIWATRSQSLMVALIIVHLPSLIVDLFKFYYYFNYDRFISTKIRKFKIFIHFNPPLNDSGLDKSYSYGVQDETLNSIYF